ncbi:DUF308 domain-containing protein [Spirillospora sp. CA-108201]
MADGHWALLQAVFAEGDGGSHVLFAVLGALSLVVGLLALRDVHRTVAVLALIVGIAWLAGGVIEFVIVLSDQARPGRRPTLVVSVLAGCSSRSGSGTPSRRRRSPDVPHPTRAPPARTRSGASSRAERVQVRTVPAALNSDARRAEPLGVRARSPRTAATAAPCRRTCRGR